MAALLECHLTLRGLYLSVNAFGPLTEALSRNCTLETTGLVSSSPGGTALGNLMSAAGTS